MAVRKLRINDDPILRKRSREVAAVDDRIRMLLSDMADTLHDTPNGAALAGSQVGILKRLVVIDMGEGLIKLVNPMITETSGQQECIEGCLSFPDRFGRTTRPARVTVQALNEYGETIQLPGEGEMAKCFCHEIDHLDGILFIDKVSPNRKGTEDMKKTQELVLLYNFQNTEKGRKLKAVLIQMGIRIKNVDKAAFLEPVGSLCGIEGIEKSEKQYEGEGFPEEMLVMKGMSGSRIDDLLTLLHKNKILL